MLPPKSPAISGHSATARALLRTPRAVDECDNLSTTLPSLALTESTTASVREKLEGGFNATFKTMATTMLSDTKRMGDNDDDAKEGEEGTQEGKGDTVKGYGKGDTRGAAFMPKAKDKVLYLDSETDEWVTAIVEERFEDDDTYEIVLQGGDRDTRFCNIEDMKELPQGGEGKKGEAAEDYDHGILRDTIGEVKLSHDSVTFSGEEDLEVNFSGEEEEEEEQEDIEIVDIDIGGSENDEGAEDAEDALGISDSIVVEEEDIMARDNNDENDEYSDDFDS